MTVSTLLYPVPDLVGSKSASGNCLGNLMDKHKVLDAAIHQHETVIRDFRERIHAMMQHEGNVNEEAYDSQTQAFQSEATTKVNLLSEQLEFANRELDELMRMKADMGSIHDAVRRGSVVKTDRETFFVSASVERFQANGQSLFGLSVLSPLYLAMKGKKVGDVFTYGTTSYRVLDVV